MGNERRRSPRMAVEVSVDMMLAGQSGKTKAGPVNVTLNTFSLHGGSVLLSSIQADGKHLFYDCNDPDSCCLMLRFVDEAEQSHTISCRPVWFDKEIDKVPAYYKMGFEFIRAEDRDDIKLLHQIAQGKSGKKLFRLLGDFFTRS
jgi:hypothetical protein